ncbi:MAG: putative oxidoreductase YhhX [Verrucomicrobiota bacterium]
MKRRTFLAAVGSPLLARSVLASGTVPMRIGQIGTAHPHAAAKMQAMRSLPADWEVVGFVEPDIKKAKAVAAPYQGLRSLMEEELLGMPDVRAVAVETGIEDSCATALRALRAGKHVHLDKPGALNHEEFKAMRLEAEKRGLAVQLGYMLRYNPAFQMLFQAVREGWLGEIMEIDAVMGKLAPAGLRAEIGALPGGGMFELGGHVLDAILIILGKPRAVTAFNTPTRGDGVKDNQLAILEYPKATATVRINFSDPYGAPRRRFNVTGTGGTFEIMPLESGSVKLSLAKARGKYSQGMQTLQLDLPRGKYDEEFRDLARVIRGEQSLRWNAYHDIAVHETLLKAAS